MRLPTDKVYRAFKVLDPFTDEQCKGYVRRAIAKHRVSMLLMGIVAAIAAVIVAGLGFAFVAVFMTLSPLSGSRGWFLYHQFAEGVLMVLALMLPVGAGLIAGLLLRDVWLRWAIGRELRRSTCPKCEYQLLGLRVVGTNVRCPECGMETRLDLLNLSDADLAMSAALEANARDSAPIAGGAPAP